MKPANTNTPTKAWLELRADPDLMALADPYSIRNIKNPHSPRNEGDREQKAENMLWFLRFGYSLKEAEVDIRREKIRVVR